MQHRMLLLALVSIYLGQHQAAGLGDYCANRKQFQGNNVYHTRTGSEQTIDADLTELLQTPSEPGYFTADRHTCSGNLGSCTSGVTICFTFKVPDADSIPQDVKRYLLDTGCGPYDHAGVRVYVENGWVVAEACTKDDLYSVRFSLGMSEWAGKDARLCLGVDIANQRLFVYVNDVFVAGTDVTQARQASWPLSVYDTNSRWYYGGENIYPHDPTNNGDFVQIHDIEVYSEATPSSNPLAVSNLVDRVSSYEVSPSSCYPGNDLTTLEGHTTIPGVTDECFCRQACFDEKRSYAFFMASSCECADATPDTAGDASDTCFEMYSTGPATLKEPDVDCTVTCDADSPTVEPGIEVTVTCATKSGEDAVFSVSGLGEELTTFDNTFSGSFTDEGQHTPTISVYSPNCPVQDVSVSITVASVNHVQSPEILLASEGAELSATGPTPVAVSLAVYSTGTVSCTATASIYPSGTKTLLSDKTPTMETGAVFQVTEQFAPDLPGVFPFETSCVNVGGESVDAIHVTVRGPGAAFEVLDKTETLFVEMGGDLSKLVATLNGERIDLTQVDGGVQVSLSDLCSGVYALKIADQAGVIIFEKTFAAHEMINDADASLDTGTTNAFDDFNVITADSNLGVDICLPKGSRMDILIQSVLKDTGEIATQTYYYLEMASQTNDGCVKVTAKIGQLGVYDVEIIIDNVISRFSKKFEVYVVSTKSLELGNAYVMENVTDPHEPVRIVAEITEPVDSYVFVQISPGEGDDLIYFAIPPNKDLSVERTFNVTFNKARDYIIEPLVTSDNDQVLGFPDKVIFRLGQAVGLVDVRAFRNTGTEDEEQWSESARAAAGETWKLAVSLPYGNPWHLQVDIANADGVIVQVLNRAYPNTFIPPVFDNDDGSLELSGESSGLPELSLPSEIFQPDDDDEMPEIPNELLAEAARKKRDVPADNDGGSGEESSSGDVQIESDADDKMEALREYDAYEEFFITINETGTYSVTVRASSPFDTHEVSLVPGMAIVGGGDADVRGVGANAGASFSSHKDSPLRVTRSEGLEFGLRGLAAATDSCDGFFERRDDDLGVWRTETSLTMLNDLASEAKVPNNTLWPGLYRARLQLFHSSGTNETTREKRAIGANMVVGSAGNTLKPYKTVEMFFRIMQSPIEVHGCVCSALAEELPGKSDGFRAYELPKNLVEPDGNTTSNKILTNVRIVDPDVKKLNNSALNVYVFHLQNTPDNRKIARDPELTSLLALSEKVSQSPLGVVQFYAEKNLLNDKENRTENVEVLQYWVEYDANTLDIMNHLEVVCVVKDERIEFDAFVVQFKLEANNDLAQADAAIENAFASGNYEACLSIISLNGKNTDASGEISRDERKQLDEVKTKWLRTVTKCVKVTDNVDILSKSAKTTTSLAQSPTAMSANAKDTAADSLDQTSKRAAEIGPSASKDQVAGTVSSVLTGITKIQPADSNQATSKMNKEDPVETETVISKLKFSHDPEEKVETAKERDARILEAKMKSCCQAPVERAKAAFPGVWKPMITPCEWTETAEIEGTDLTADWSRCAYYFSKVSKMYNGTFETDEQKIELMEKCSDKNSFLNKELKRIGADWLQEYEIKSDIWKDDKQCNAFDIDTRLDEYEPRYAVWASIVQLIDFKSRAGTMKKAESAFGSMGKAIGEKTGPGGDTKIEADGLSMEVLKLNAEGSHARFRRSTDGKHMIDHDGTHLPASVLKNAGGMQQTNSKKNAYTFSSQAKGEKPADKLVSTGTTSLSMTAADGSELAVNNTDEPFIIVLAGVEEKAKTLEKLQMVLVSDDDTPKFKIHLPNEGSAAFLYVEPNDLDAYKVYFMLDKSENGSVPINHTNYEYVTTVPNEAKVKYARLGDRFDPRYIVHVPNNYTREAGYAKFMIELNKYSVTVGQQLNHTFQCALSGRGCQYWNKGKAKWLNDGCQVSEQTTMESVKCACNHLTSFGGDFAVPPNTIDFSTVFSAEKFLESMPVFCTVIILISIYVGGLVWARREDKKDLIKWGASPLEDNLPSDNYHYQVTVNTGVRKKAGTTSRVSFILSGDDCDTGVRRIFDGKRKEFPAGSIYNYVLSTEQSLGPLTYMRIWHDNSGKGINKGWYLDQIQITDLQNGDRFFFLNDRWLAVEEDDGMVERILPVAGLSDLSAFKHLFSSSVRKKLTNDHMWFSVVSRPTRSNFTRVQRISCCISLLFLTMITNCMFFKSDERAENVSAVSIGPFSFTLHQLFISIVTTGIVFPPSLAIVTIFRKAKPKKTSVMQSNQTQSKKHKWRTLNPGSSLWSNSEKTKMQKFKDNFKNMMTVNNKSKYEADSEEQPTKGGKKKKGGFKLPFWTMYIAWILVFFSVVASGFFTILYSMEWGREKSLDWLSTFVLSFFQSVVVVQPIKVLLLAAFISCIMRKPEFDNEEDDFDDCQAGPSAQSNLTTSQRDLQEIIKQRQMAATEVKPPDMASLEKARTKRLQEIQMGAILKECIVYFFFIIVLFFLSYQVRDPDSFTFANNIKQQFLENSPNFGSITTPTTFWAWANQVLVPNMYSSEWYNGDALDWREALQLGDRNTMRVGVGRIRQLRIKEDSCEVQDVFQSMISHCRNHYNWIDDDTKDYLSGWREPEEGEEDLVYEDTRSPWVYRNSVELKNAPYAGLLTMYKGGGYTFSFRRSASKTLRLMKTLEAQEWIGTKTRGVFVEYTLYNANINLFGSVIMLVEFMATGAAITKTEVKVFRLNSYVGGFGIIVIFFEVVYLCFTLYFFGKMCKDLKKQKLKYFKEFWNMLEFATLILSLIAIVMYAMKKVFGTVAMNVLHESGYRDFVNFVTISIWDEMFGFILAMVVFLATLKFIKMLRFNRRMGMLGDTIKLATRDLKYFTITFFIYFFAFCQWAYLMFGPHLPSYGSFIGSAEALFSFALGSFDFYEFQAAHRVLGPFFFFLYVGIVYIGLMGMFLTIIYDAFAAVKADADLRSNDYEIVDFMMKKFKGVFGWGGEETEGGGEEMEGEAN